MTEIRSSDNPTQLLTIASLDFDDQLPSGDQRQNSGMVSASRGPSLSGAIFSAKPVASDISTPTPQMVAGPEAASKRPFGIFEMKRLRGSSFSMPSEES